MQYLHPHIKRNEITPLIVFSFFIALSVVLSNHIQITGNPYSGLATQNYITPYGLSDIGVLVAAFTVVLLCCLALYQITCKAITAKSAGNNKPLAAKPIAACTAIMFALHLPYLLTYYPGFVFSDSLSSIGQALGQLPCSNHFPIAYTALIGACIALAHTLGLSTTTGCALYSLMQTFVMCITYSLMIQWIMQRTRIARWWRAILVAVFGLAPYIATYSIALWKDPLFSAAIVVVTVLLFDFVSTSGKSSTVARRGFQCSLCAASSLRFYAATGYSSMRAYSQLCCYARRRERQAYGERPQTPSPPSRLPPLR